MNQLLRWWRSGLATGLLLAGTATAFAKPPEGFVYLDEAVPGVVFELRYATENNFVGTRIDGYVHARAIMTREGAEALKAVQQNLERFGLGLKVFDAYRPQRAVDHFVRWAEDLEDTQTKAEYYPRVPKDALFERLYIADRSSHSRGSTADVTIISLSDRKELDMGTPFDFFDVRSWPDAKEITAEQRAHRMLLRTVMMKHGFKPYEQEWWHFTLADEPYPETFFNFPVE